ncbi:hypothetical protein [Peptoniphilus vaginalis]|uniref:hypothetical protein n=1 Tax=Peptoniphilus vaginalis TaxID=1756987 RepID=UPI0023F9BCDC|nr:hypothetical protein [Peptoniphilus vaginalis]
MAKQKIIIDAVFVARVQQLIEVCGTNKKVAKICGVAPGFLSMVKNGHIVKLTPEVYERFNSLFGKSLEEIEAEQNKLLKKIKKERDLQAKKDKDLADKRQEKMLAIDKRVSDIKVGKRYHIDFYPDQKGPKLRDIDEVDGEVIEIYERFFLIQTKNFKITVLKKEVKYGLVKMTEVWKYK